MKRSIDDFGDLLRRFDLGDPFCGRAEKGPIIHLLKGAPPKHRALDLADEQDHRCRIVLGDMDAVRRVGRAWTACDEANPRSPGQATLCQRRHRRPGLLTAYHDLDGRVVHCVERRQVGFARNAVNLRNGLNDELIDEKLAAGSRRCDGHEDRFLRQLGAV